MELSFGSFITKHILNHFNSLLSQTATIYIVVGVVVLLAFVLVICVIVVTYWLKREYKLATVQTGVFEVSYLPCIVYVVILFSFN